MSFRASSFTTRSATPTLGLTAVIYRHAPEAVTTLRHAGAISNRLGLAALTMLIGLWVQQASADSSREVSR